MSELNELLKILCPLTRSNGTNGKTYVCNKLLVKVAPGSKGEAYCPRCDKHVEFSVDTGSGVDVDQNDLRIKV